MPVLVDTHCHLFEHPLIDDIDGVLARARVNGVTSIVVPAYNYESWTIVDKLSSHAGVYAAFGIHPWVAGDGVDIDKLGAALQLPRTVAVGEIGLDFAIKGFDKRQQVAVFERQLALACDLNLPVLLHCRSAFEDMHAILQRYQPRLRAVLHAFSRSHELAQRFIKLGCMIAFGGAVTRPEANRVRAAVQRLAIEHIVLETDAPAIGLDGVEARAVEPRHVHDIATAVARLRNTEFDSLAKDTSDNAKRFFGFS